MPVPVGGVRPPAQLRRAAALWFLAIGAGVFETVVVTASALAQDGVRAGQLVAQVVLRIVAFAAASWLTLQLVKGRRGARPALTLLLSVAGLASLLIGPAEWLAAGHRLTDAVRDLTPSSGTFAVSRVIHVLAVVAATVLMYRPAVSGYLRERRLGRAVSACAPPVPPGPASRS